MFFFPVSKQIEFACNKCTDLPWFEHPIQKFLFNFTVQDLIEYLRKKPEVCEDIIIRDGDKRGSDTIVIGTQNGYLVGKTRHNIQHLDQVQIFDKIEEAAADYVLLNWKLPRLRSAKSERKLRCPDFNTFYDEHGSIVDKLKGNFKYYDSAEKKWVYYD